jgi:hypothetical protein
MGKVVTINKTGLYALWEEINENKKTYLQAMHLYHYTDIDSFVKILKSKSFWATNCEYLNDLSELKNIEDCYEKVFKKMDNKFREFLLFFKKSILDDYLVDFRKRTYIISFSEIYDSIGMWRNYGNNGLAIELDTKILMDTLFQKNITRVFDRHNEEKNIPMGYKSIGKIIYNDKKLIDTIRKYLEVIYNLEEANNKLEDEYYQTNRPFSILTKEVIMNLNSFAPIKKDKNFEFEKEMRMVFTLSKKNINEVENFRVKNGLIIPYINIIFEDNKLIPIKRVILNPEQNDIMFNNGLRRLLNSYGYNKVQIISSRSKIRK